ncbi:MAG: Histidine kinase-, DNA gyrase B-, and HSP90-like protein ATPase [uncultured bacterium]|nr:MAG: Histidine kinase-, DNA gyrase B-, and HSP90-like protein ATPase [uncultured bacterium]
MDSSFVTIRFDKSHLTSIGQRLYSQSLDLIRELVANAYDADATKVNITVDSENLTVEDDGSGMNREGIEQYFTIGSPFKKENPVSNVFKRTRIGEFGIGKFAVLSLCDRFEIYTFSKDYGATVIFDRADFEERGDWKMPIIEHKSNGEKTGTRVTLFHLKKPLSLFDLERYLINLFPLTDKDFSIFLNEKKLQPTYIPGERFKISEITLHGIIKGEIVISSLMLNKDQVGVGIRVKGVLVKRETFEIEASHSLSSRRLTGEIRADFLPITTDRSNFLTDSKEYLDFWAIMKKKLRRVVKSLEKSAVNYQDKKAERLLSDVLVMIREALGKNRDIFMTGDLPLFSKSNQKKKMDGQIGDKIISTALSKKPSAPSIDKEELSGFKKALKEAVQKLRPKIRRRVKTLLRDERRIIKKVKMGGSEFLVSFAHLGEDERESFIEGGMVFINRDHKLFQKLEQKNDLIFYHLVRLVSQELVKFSSPRNMEIAFDWLGKLIKDAYLANKEFSNKNKSKSLS